MGKVGGSVKPQYKCKTHTKNIKHKFQSRNTQQWALCIDIEQKVGSLGHTNELNGGLLDELIGCNASECSGEYSCEHLDGRNT